MLRAIEDRACLLPFYEKSATTDGSVLMCSTAPCYEDEKGICNPGLTPSRGCRPPFLSTSDPGIFTDASGPCNPEFSPDSWFTVAPTPGTKPSTLIPGISNTTLMMIAGGLFLVMALAGKK